MTNYYSEPLEKEELYFNDFLWRCFRGAFFSKYLNRDLVNIKIPKKIIIDNSKEIKELQEIELKIIKILNELELSFENRKEEEAEKLNEFSQG